MQLVLASQSSGRLAVLRAAGVEPVVRVSGVDEDAIAASLSDAAPDEIVTTLAEAKARAVAGSIAETHPEAVVVGCDSMLAHGGELIGKPGTAHRARERLSRQAGSSGDLLTGHAVLRVQGGRLGPTAAGTERTTIRFGKLSAAEIDAYVRTGEPLGVAGGFTIDGYGGWFVDGVDGVPSSVIGISLPLTRRLLGEVGVSVAELWNR